MDNQQGLRCNQRDELIELFCSRLRVQLKLDSYRLRFQRKPSHIQITAPSGNQWFISYLALNLWDYAQLTVGYVADYSRLKIEQEVATAHLKHVMSEFNKAAAVYRSHQTIIVLD